MSEFFVLLPIRDESDIIAQFLDHLLKWADAIYAVDTGSADNTWEIVQDFALSEKRVLPMRKEPVLFSEARLRGHMFHSTTIPHPRRTAMHPRFLFANSGSTSSKIPCEQRTAAASPRDRRRIPT